MPEWLILFMIFSWAGPIGLGALLAGLGIYYWGVAQKELARHKTG